MKMTNSTKVNLTYDIQATSGMAPGATPAVVLLWTPVEGATGYYLYRKLQGNSKSILINPKHPVRMVQTCQELEAIIPKGSAEWEMLRHAIGKVALEKEFAPSLGGTTSVVFPNYPIVIDPISKIPSGGVASSIKQQSYDPCKALERGFTSEELELFITMASLNLKIRLAMGLGYIDTNVEEGSTYEYSIRARMPGGTFLESGTAVIILVDTTPPDPPSGIETTTGDGEVLVTWNRNPAAFGYILERSLDPSNPFNRIHDETIMYSIWKDPELIVQSEPEKPGFIDFKRWNSEGLPVSHEVLGIAIEGPSNGISYYYRVASCTIFGETGPWSAPKVAIPIDLTPPRAPEELTVTPTEYPDRGLAVAWRKVTRDVRGHQELDSIHTYEVFRSDKRESLEDPDSLGNTPVYSLSINPLAPQICTLSWIDTSSEIFPLYGEQDFYYRVRCIDAANNKGALSAIISGRLPDITPPGPTTVIKTVGHPDSIELFWDQNPEPDLAGYQIYRSICNKGEFYAPTKSYDIIVQKKKGCDFGLVGETLLKEPNGPGLNQECTSYRDTSVPKDSPVCYAYWVRAFDQARNLYQGSGGCPASKNEYKCGRIVEGISPPYPVITGLCAEHRAVVISWAASPVQDLRAFHIYRSRNENEVGEFAGCVLRDGTIFGQRWTGTTPKCDEIPAEAGPEAVMGSYRDENLDPHVIYWYRVSALDWVGNESNGDDLLKIPAVSTFTYTRDHPQIPIIASLYLSSSEQCGITIHWSPPFDSSVHTGFIVFRSSSKKSSYRQVSPLVKDNMYTDLSAPRNRGLWYRVQSMDIHGLLSAPSEPVFCHYKEAQS